MEALIYLLCVLLGAVRAGTGKKNHVHLNSVTQDPSTWQGQPPSYTLDISADRDVSGNIVLMQNETGAPGDWRNAGTIYTKDIGPRHTYVHSGKEMKNDCYYCVCLEGDDGMLYYSSAYRRDDDSEGFVRDPSIELRDRMANEDNETVVVENQQSYWQRHKASIIVFISLGSVVLLLAIYLLLRN